MRGKAKAWSDRDPGDKLRYFTKLKAVQKVPSARLSALKVPLVGVLEALPAITTSGVNTVVTMLLHYEDEEAPDMRASYVRLKGLGKNTVSEEYLRCLYGRKEGDKRVAAHKASSAITQASLAAKYGDDLGKVKYENYLSKQRVKFTPEAFVERHGVDAAEMQRLYKEKHKQDCSKEHYVKLHGEAAWKERFLYANTKGSRESLRILLPLYKHLRKLGLQRKDIYFGIGSSKEYFLRHEDGRYMYDFTVPSLKLIVEYNGIAFHPKQGDANWLNPFDKSITADVQFGRDQAKINFAKDAGYNVLVLWSDDDQGENIKTAIQFINDEYDSSKS